MTTPSKANFFLLFQFDECVSITLCHQRRSTTTIVGLRKFKAVLSFLFLLLFTHEQAMSQFTDVTSDVGINMDGNTPLFGNGVSFYDFNKDGYDDLTFCSRDFGVHTYINYVDHFEEIDLFGYIDGDLKQPTWVDVDNDGDEDFFVTRLYDVPLFYRNLGNLTFVNANSDFVFASEHPMSTCCSWGDYDNDSFVDVFISNYFQSGSVTSWLFHNNAGINFTDVSVALGVNNGVNPAYQCTWTDYDLDMDVDLFVVNDKLIGNRLYRNDGEGIFNNIADSTGFSVLADCMGLSVADYDADGDFDFYITNTEEGNFLLSNENGIFTNLAAVAGVACYNQTWGSVFVNYDNKLYEALYVMVDQGIVGHHNLFFAQADGWFTETNISPGTTDNEASFSVAKGDFNNDGFYDLVATHITPVAATLWQNNGGDTHWLKIDLEGTVSNRDGIGATMKLFANGTCILKQKLCGENYMSQDSGKIIFALNGALMADSLVVMWPSGWADRYYEIECDQHLYLVEGGSMAETNQTIVWMICESDSIELVAPEATTYSWDNGAISREIVVSQPGEYVVAMTNSMGIEFIQLFVVEVLPFEWPSIVANHPMCYDEPGGSIVFDSSEILEVLVMDGNGNTWDEPLYGLMEGDYFMHATILNGCGHDTVFSLVAPEPLSALSLTDTICYGDSASVMLEVAGGQPPYLIDWFEAIPESLYPGEYEVRVTDANNCISDFEYSLYAYEPILFSYAYSPPCYGAETAMEYSASGGSGLFSFDFDEEDPLSIAAGNFHVLITDSYACFSFVEFAIVENPEMTVVANITQAQTCANGNIDLLPEGGTPPYAFLWNDQSSDSSLLNIPPGVYSCVVTDAQGCTVFIETEVIHLNVLESMNSVSVFPNPFSEKISVSLDFPAPVYITDALGKRIWDESTARTLHEINTSQLSHGIYYVVAGERKIKLVK